MEHKGRLFSYVGKIFKERNAPTISSTIHTLMCSEQE